MLEIQKQPKGDMSKLFHFQMDFETVEGNIQQ